MSAAMRGDRALVVEAALLLLLIRVAFLLFPFQPIERALARWYPPRRRGSGVASDVMAQRVGAAVRTTGRRVPGATCLSEALAAETMLRARGVTSTRHIGVRAPAAGVPLDAHAWLEAHGAIVVGQQPDLADYRILTKRS
jgi:hypothetical protein